ncbi:MAG: FAD-dependent oxidoreductase [Ekhidna sp.]|nr:FAD-dependent oxidoreductase [Ekhidna sp.]
MDNRLPFLSFLFFLLTILSCKKFTQTNGEHGGTVYDVIIVGGGASGTMSGIQASRMGASTLIIEETPWLGGMFTAAGVSAIDGNYRLPSGLWQEFREALIAYYGHEDSLKTGWVSNVLFEPHQAVKILEQMTKAEPNLNLSLNSTFIAAEQNKDLWKVSFHQGNTDTIALHARILIDGTELGDVARHVGISYDIGMDSKKITNEAIAPEEANNIIQDITYVAILKDYGPGADKTIPKPDHYDPSPFYCTCDAGLCDEEDTENKLWSCQQMMNYGKLPNGYYMINWPIAGNDYYLNSIDMNPEERREAFKKAKAHTLSYIYYLQTELGFRHLGLANDVFPTEDNLPLIPYHRESRRIKGLVRFNINDLAEPFKQEYPLYRTGIAVGDYPVDHHHKAHPNYEQLPDLHFYPVPSYAVPLGSLIPENMDNFLVVEKSISVTNLVNGTTRLQPVCMLIGQAAGTLAALATHQDKSPKHVRVREVQKVLLDHQAFILPYSDINPASRAFKPLQKIGSTGILRGEGKNIGWENHTHIYPDSLLTISALKTGLADWLDTAQLNFRDKFVQVKELETVFSAFANNYSLTLEKSLSEQINGIIAENKMTFSEGKYIERSDFAILLDSIIDPFMLRQIDHYGRFEETRDN